MAPGWLLALTHTAAIKSARACCLSSSFSLSSPSRCKGSTRISEDSSEIAFLLVENYKTDRSNWYSYRFGIFGPSRALSRETAHFSSRAPFYTNGHEEELCRRAPRASPTPVPGAQCSVAPKCRPAKSLSSDARYRCWPPLLYGLPLLVAAAAAAARPVPCRPLQALTRLSPGSHQALQASPRYDVRRVSKFLRKFRRLQWLYGRLNHIPIRRPMPGSRNVQVGRGRGRTGRDKPIWATHGGTAATPRWAADA